MGRASSKSGNVPFATGSGSKFSISRTATGHCGLVALPET
ncbi:hypothetical protein ACVIQT_009288 [Bradyrhizobium diazoefficiens]